MDIRDEKHIIGRYAKYYEVIEKIRDIKMSERITVRKLKMRSGLIKNIYDDMKALNFPGDAIDFLCYVDLQYQLMTALYYSDNLKELINNFLRSRVNKLRTAMRIYRSENIDVIGQTLALAKLEDTFGEKSLMKFIPMFGKAINERIINELANEKCVEYAKPYMDALKKKKK